MDELTPLINSQFMKYKQYNVTTYRGIWNATMNKISSSSPVLNTYFVTNTKTFMDQPTGAMNLISIALIVRHLLPAPTLYKPSKFKVETFFASKKFHLVHTISTGDLGKEMELYGGDWGFVDLGTYIIGNNQKWETDIDEPESDEIFTLKLTGIDLVGTIYPANTLHIVRRVVGISPKVYTKTWTSNREVVSTDSIGRIEFRNEDGYILDLGPECYGAFEGSFLLRQPVSAGDTIEISAQSTYYVVSTNTYGQMFETPVAIDSITPNVNDSKNFLLRSGDREIPSILVNVATGSTNQTGIARTFSFKFRFKAVDNVDRGSYRYRVDLFNKNTIGGSIRVTRTTSTTYLVTTTHDLKDRDTE